MTECGIHWAGAACDWPLCVHGRADSATKTCNCYNYFAPPFCITCLPGYWGENCDRQPLNPVSSFENIKLAIPPFVVHLFLLGILVALIIAFWFFILFAYRFVKSKLPPPYEEVIKDMPPPYTV